MKIKLPNLSSEISFFGRVSVLDVLAFTKHIALLLKSGISLPEAIALLEQRTPHSLFKQVLQGIHQDMANGQKLSKSLAKYPTIFDAFYIHLISVAEASGSLEKNLDYLAVHLKKQHEFSSKIKAAMLYPSIVLGVACVCGIGVSVFVLPKLIDLFASLDIELPLSTQILLFFARMMRDFGVLIVIGLVVCAAILKYLTTTKLCKPLWHTVLLTLPVIGMFLQRIQLASLFRNFGTMLGVGVPLAIALDALSDITTNTLYKKIIDQIKNGVRKGKTIEDILLADTQKYMPLIAIRMIGVGEKTGRLDETCIYLGEYFEDEVDETTKNLSTILEPIILIIVGLLVGFIAISIIGPIYQFTGSIKR